MPELIDEILIKDTLVVSKFISELEKVFPQPKPIEYEEIGYFTCFVDERRYISGVQSKHIISGLKYVKRQNQSKIQK